MIELFKQPNIDWMGKAKYFFALSGLLLIIGWSAILFKGGIKYGIDFKGGTNVDVRFAQPPNIDKLRSGLSAQGLGNSEIQLSSRHWQFQRQRSADLRRRRRPERPGPRREQDQGPQSP